eukprot:1380472-Heterocapsa_arctica.AAC.1
MDQGWRTHPQTTMQLGGLSCKVRHEKAQVWSTRKGDVQWKPSDQNRATGDGGGQSTHGEGVLSLRFYGDRTKGTASHAENEIGKNGPNSADNYHGAVSYTHLRAHETRSNL